MVAVELAAAYVALVPSAKGIEGSITRQLAGLPSVFGKVGDQAGAQMEAGVKKRIGNVTKLIGAVGVGTLLKGAFDEAQEAQKVGAQTTQVIKSTGSAANVTADQVGDLSTAISKYAGIDDEAIQAGENMLLTFTNVRNEAGEGNDIFNQATKILVDMSVAMGTDAKSGAIQLGKALNDPIKGITALTRVGVTFSDQQKQQIAVMVQAGNAAGAQKIILAELNKEFGGSAAAQATAADKAKVAWGNLEETLGTALMPAITAVANVVTNDLVPPLSASIGFVQRNSTVFKILGGVVLGTWAAFKGYTIIKSVITSMSLLSARYQQYIAQLSYGNRAQQAAGRGLGTVSGSAGKLAGTLSVVGAAVTVGTLLWGRHSAATARAKQHVEDLTQAIEEDSGALGENSRAQVINNLEKDGVLKLARELGVSLTDVTDAVLGNTNAQHRLNVELDALGGHADYTAIKVQNLRDDMNDQTGVVHKSVQAAKDKAAADGQAAGAVGKLGTATQQTTQKVKSQVQQMIDANDAVGLLRREFDRLNNKTLDVRDANVEFHSSLLSVDQALKDNGRTLSLNTQAGIANNQAISSAIKNAQAHAEAISGGTNLTAAGTKAYRDDLTALRDHIKAVGGDTTAIQKLIDKIAATPTVHHTRMEIQTAQAKHDAEVYAQWLKDHLGTVRTVAEIAVKVFEAGERGTAGVVGHNAAGTRNWRGGPTWVGERGRELVDLPRGAKVYDNRTSEKMAASRGDTYVTLNSYNNVATPETISLVASLRAAAAELSN